MKVFESATRRTGKGVAPHGMEDKDGFAEIIRSLGVSACLLLLASCAGSAEDRGSGNWPGYGGPVGDQHYSPLDQINDGNVGRLGLAWFHDIDVGGSSLTAPVAVDGVLYFAAGYSVVHALDAVTGKELWRYDPKSPQVAGEKMRAAWGSRGLAYDDGKIFVGTIDGRLIALDARSGGPLWSAMTVDKNDGRYITGAPWTFNGKVIIGHGGADFAPVRGYVTAYDQKTGRQLWRFHTVPGDPAKGFENEAMEMAARTWTGEWWKYGGGGTAWNAFAYDPRFNRIYVGTGNGAPWNRTIRSPGGGDNLFLSSIVALDADTGDYAWHYQTTPGESWDYNSAMDIELADLKIGGETRPVILHAPKNGFFYVLDRQTGKLMSAEKIVPVTWAERIDVATGRPVENPAARYLDGKPAIVYPSEKGAHSIEAMAFNPKTGLVYIPVIDHGQAYMDPPGALADWRHQSGQRFSPGVSYPNEPGLRQPKSALLAWNPVTQRPAWRTPTTAGWRSGGATATTAGNLVLQGRESGQFQAFAADSGRQLWSFDGQTSVTAQPIVYAVKGRQYITVIAGARFWSAKDRDRVWNYRTQQWRVLTFALDGKAKLPPALKEEPSIADDPAFRVDSARAAAGARTFGERCAICHGENADAAGAAPSLLESGVPMDLASFKAVVQQGLLLDRGMPRFSELNDDEMESLQHYVRARAREEGVRRTKSD